MVCEVCNQDKCLMPMSCNMIKASMKAQGTAPAPIINIHRNEQASSFTIGNSKTGIVEVHFDADNPTDGEVKLQNAIAILLRNREKVLGVI